LQFAAHLFDPLAHSAETDTIVAFPGFESVAVIAKLQA